MDRLAAMEAFVRVIETGSFSAAAQQMRLGQPAVSKAVGQLEQRLGVRLVLRSTRGLTPTEAGQSFYQEAKAIIERAEQAELAASSSGKGLSGRLRISAPVTFAPLAYCSKAQAPAEGASDIGHGGDPQRPRGWRDRGGDRRGALDGISRRFRLDGSQGRLMPPHRSRHAALFPGIRETDEAARPEPA